MAEKTKCEIVISGISGRFPEADNVDEYYEKLINKVDLITENDNRFKAGCFGTPKRFGKIKDLTKFDNKFFGYNLDEMVDLEIEARFLLEITYETIVDAGYDPSELRGKNIGIFLATCSDSVLPTSLATRDLEKFRSVPLVGHLKSSLINRISSGFDFKGPSMIVDSACSSAAYAMYEAFQAIRSGSCDAAIVGGTNVIVTPEVTLGFHKLNMLSHDGKSKSFDASADGFVRSETISTIFLQKCEDARRIYATLVSVKANNDGFKVEGQTYPSSEMQKRLMVGVLNESNLHPNEISYVEVHATGTNVGDPVEMLAIDNAFCTDRKETLLVGSVKSNSGHPEPSAALCQLAKLLLSMERGVLPPNLHFNEPHPEIKVLKDGRAKVVTEPTPWTGQYTGLSSFGFGGANVHCILKPNLITPQQANESYDQIPRLILYSGRTKEGVQYLLESTTVKEAPREFFALLHKSAYISPMLNPYRGFKLLEEKIEVQDIQKNEYGKRPLWYVFRGFDAERPAMMKSLMKIEIFAKSIRKSSEILKPLAIDLLNIVVDEIKSEVSSCCKTNQRRRFQDIISTVAVQVALVDVLDKLGLKPDGIIGHNLGELVCAYADGCLTAEQVLTSSYWLAKAAEEVDVPHGTITKMRSSHEALGCCCMSTFNCDVTLKAGDGTKQELNHCNCSNNWEHLTPATKKYELLLREAIPDPKLRSSRWKSISHPADEWNDPEVTVASAMYFIHNLLSPVLFDEVLHCIPKDAVIIEIGPQNLFDVTIKTEIGLDVSINSLMKKSGNSVVNLLSSIGELYIFGYDPDIEKLYPPVTFPVPRSTPTISPLIKWDHSETHHIYKWNMKSMLPISTEFELETGLLHSPDRYLLGHCTDGRSILPATGYMFLVWKTFGRIQELDDINDVPVEFENVKFLRTTLLSETEDTKIVVNMSKTSGRFEITQSGMTVCTGIAKSPNERDRRNTSMDLKIDTEELVLNANDIYKEFRLKGYEYGSTFQGIIAANLSGSEGLLKQNDNWVVFLDTCLQLSILKIPTRDLLLPTGIRSLIIDPVEHTKLAEKAFKEYEGIPVKFDSESRETFSAGVYARLATSGYQRKRPDNRSPLLEEYKFIPYVMQFPLEAQAEQHKEYISLCSSVAKHILKSSGKEIEQCDNCMDALEIRDELKNKYLESENNSNALLKCLSNIEKTENDKQRAQNVKECTSNYINEIGDEISNQILLNEFCLKTAFEIIMENFSRTLKVVEITEGVHAISSKIHEIIPVSVAVNISYSVVHSNTELLNQDNLPPNFNIITWKNKPSLEFKDFDVFILNYLTGSAVDLREILENATACLKSEGFILFYAETKLIPAEVILSSISEILIPSIEENCLEELFKEMNLNVICKMFDAYASTLYLLRKSSKISFIDSIVHVTTGEYAEWVDKLKEEIVKAQKPQASPSQKRIWLVSEGSRHSGIVGLVNCLRLEPGGPNIRCVFTGRETSKIPPFSLTEPFYKNQLDKNLVMNVFQNGSWGSFRHLRCEEDSSASKTKDAYLDILTVGDLSSFVWIDLSMENRTVTDDHVICHVYYAALNFKDIMLATGRLPLSEISGASILAEGLVGFEFSGRTPDGRRVMGIVSNKAMATTLIAKRLLLWDVPEEWSLKEAATVPIVYSTAYYALITRGRLQHGEKILIHSGSGGVGQAAINISLSIGCHVYTTVGSEEKKKFLIEKFPQLREEHIYNSRDTTFEQHILHDTKGEGVHVVLNSLAGDKLFASLNCLAEEGRFLEIGKYDMANDSNIGMAIFLKNVSFHGILLDTLINDVTDEMNLELFELLNKGIADGVVKPLNTTVFNHEEAEKAFRYMASGKHIGKVVLKIRDEEEVKNVIPSSVYVTAKQRTTFNPQKSYIIIGGLGGIGLELCQWLIERGAKNVVLTSRSGVTTGYQKMCLKRWKQYYSVNVVVSKLNAVIEDEARELLLLASKQGPVGGIFNLALVLKDALMENQTVQNYIDVCECKIESTENLDLLSREMCPDLDMFVCFSSTSCGRGNLGQSNYGYANSVMDRICEDRVNEGLPGLSVQWGPIGDVGLVKEKMGSNVVIGGTVPQRISSCFAVFEKFLQQHSPVVSSMVLYQAEKDKVSISIKEDLLAHIANIFGIKDVASIDREATLKELGMDSLMGVELKHILEHNFNTVLSINELRNLKVKDFENISNKKGTIDVEKATENQALNMQMHFGKYNALNSKELFSSDVIIHINEITDGIPLFIVHPVEGSVTSLRYLAEILPCPVYGIQSTFEAPRDSIESLAAWYWKNIKPMNIPMQHINLAGYSFGATVAFEMALQLQQDDKSYPEIKNLIFLDGSHKASVLLSILNRFDVNMENVEDQILALTFFSKMFSDDNLLEKKELLNLKGFPERISCAANRIASACRDFSFDDILELFDLFRSKLQMMLQYVPKLKLKQDVHLIKSSEKLHTIEKLLTDVYDLDKVCEGKISSYVIQGNHSSFIQGNSAKEVSRVMENIFESK